MASRAKLDWRHVEDIIDDQRVCKQLREHDHAIVNGMWSNEDATAFRDELQSLFENDLMEPNKVEFLTSSGPVRLTKPGIFERDLHGASNAHEALAPHLLCLFATAYKLVGIINERMPDLNLGDDAANAQNTGSSDTARSPRHYTLKLQVNDGTGGCFPWHYDNPARPNRRALTCLTYLNDTWEDGDGGEIVLLPFLGKPVVVPPRMNTTVFFRSDRVLHRVLVCQRPRFCFTLWFDSADVNSDQHMNLRAKHLDVSKLDVIKASPLQRTLSRAVYAEEYVRSLTECFGDGTKGQRLSLALHQAHLKSLLQNKQVSDFVDQLRRVKAEVMDQPAECQS